MISVMVGIGLVIASTFTHHEILYLLAHQLRRRFFRPRFSLFFGVIGALIAHFVEIVLFSVGFYLLIRGDVYGTLVGKTSEDYSDILYFSFVTYSSLGYGDITPEGQLRFVAVMEVITGLVMIAWTASFLYSLILVAWKRE